MLCRLKACTVVVVLGWRLCRLEAGSGGGVRVEAVEARGLYSGGGVRVEAVEAI